MLRFAVSFVVEPAFVLACTGVILDPSLLDVIRGIRGYSYRKQVGLTFCLDSTRSQVQVKALQWEVAFHHMMSIISASRFHLNLS